MSRANSACYHSWSETKSISRPFRSPTISIGWLRKRNRIPQQIWVVVTIVKTKYSIQTHKLECFHDSGSDVCYSEIDLFVFGEFIESHQFAKYGRRHELNAFQIKGQLLATGGRAAAEFKEFLPSVLNLDFIADFGFGEEHDDLVWSLSVPKHHSVLIDQNKLTDGWLHEYRIIGAHWQVRGGLYRDPTNGMLWSGSWFCVTPRVATVLKRCERSLSESLIINVDAISL